MLSSTIISLYLPYSNLVYSGSSLPASLFSETALREVKEAVSMIARIVDMLEYKAESNDIPLSMFVCSGGWGQKCILTMILEERGSYFQ